jgi:hypothetical protein
MYVPLMITSVSPTPEIDISKRAKSLHAVVHIRRRDWRERIGSRFEETEKVRRKHKRTPNIVNEIIFVQTPEVAAVLADVGM